MKGKFITLEGGEGAGKSTALTFIQDYLTKAGKEVVVTREPGGTPVAEAIRQLLLNPDLPEPLDPKTELLLMFASRAQHLAQRIQPALEAGKWVVCDRFVDASYAYQQGGRGLAVKWIEDLDQFVVADLRPELTILLDIDPKIGLARSKTRGPQDRFEQENLAFFEKVRHAYLARAAEDKARFRIIDAAQPLPLVQGQIALVLNGLL